MRKSLLMLAAVAVIGIVAGACSKHLPTEVSRTALPSRGDVITTEGCDLLIGDLVWADLNANGCQDSGEPGISGITVRLHDAATNAVILSDVTDANGHYKFEKLCAGEYAIEVVVPKDCFITNGDGCWDDKDSDPNFIVVKLTSKTTQYDFGIFCKGSEKEDCGPCEGKVNELTLRYNGAAPAEVIVEQKKSKNVENFAGTVNPGELFTIVGLDKKGTLGTEIKIFVNGVLHTQIHTSCSQPIGPGLIFGDFEIVAGRSLKGGPLCPLDPPSQGGGDFCETYGRPRGLVMQYTAEGCEATHHSQDAGKVVCTSLGTLPAVARIKVTDSATEGAGKIWFDGFVPVGTNFTFSAANAGASALASNSWAYIYDEGVLVQKVQFHTSCSQPLILGDQFGSLRLEGFVPQP